MVTEENSAVEGKAWYNKIVKWSLSQKTRARV